MTFSIKMRDFTAKALLAGGVLLGSAGCSTTLSTLQPAKPVGAGHVHVGVGANVNLPVSSAVGAIAESTRVAARLSSESRAPNEAEQRALVDAMLPLAINPPGATPDLMLRYGVVDAVDVGLRYSGSAIHGDVKAALYDEEPFTIAVSLGYSRQRFSGLLFDALDYLNIGDYSRNNIEVPLIFGLKLKEYGHVWFGPKFIGSFYSLDASVKDVGLVAQSSGFIQHYGAFGGIALGYKYVFAVAELTAMYMVAKPTIAGRQVDLGGLVLMPSMGVMVRY